MGYAPQTLPKVGDVVIKRLKYGTPIPYVIVKISNKHEECLVGEKYQLFSELEYLTDNVWVVDER